ncbi:MAG: radical SAM protein [Clostridia bacterium]|nr:radical SAM protein [Clostridia bacterium]
MKISKRDAYSWFQFFASLPEDEELMNYQKEIAFAVLSQIELATQKRHEELKGEIKTLKSLCGRSLYVGPDDKFSAGCKSCLTGSGLTAIRKTNKCNIQCKFCYNYGELDQIAPIGEGMWEIGGTKFRLEDIDLLMSTCKKPTGISYVYLEPFMEIEKYYPIIRKFREYGIHQHMYTNGLLANEENLKALGEAGLDELRFNLGASNCADVVIENIAIAKKYIPFVGIETPMTKEFYASFLAKKEKVLGTGFDFMNCAELHLNPNNVLNYEGENMYMYRHGYLSPVWSREITFKIMKMAEEENWPCVIHDCSNQTKFARDLNLRAKEGGWFGASSYGCEFGGIPFEAFLPVLSDDSFEFLEEEELPEGYRPGDMFF